MSDVFALHEMEAVKVKVKKCDGRSDPVYKKFSIDPRITSFDVLRKLLGKAFEIKSDFSISYLGKDEHGKQVYLSLLSDWDLDAALPVYADPCLRLKVDLQPFPAGFEDWEIICPVDVPEQPANMPSSPRRCSSFRDHLSSISRKMEQVQKVFHLTDNEALTKSPMTDSEYRNFLDSAGKLVRPRELRRSVFLGGCDPHIRKYVWRMLLNVFPDGLTGQGRLDYMKKKSKEYYEMRAEWKHQMEHGTHSHQLKYITNLVKKDVLRTDRTLKFYAGSDENKNVLSLYNILTTYAMTHPSVSYCQGMSDLASPLLYVMKDEAHAFICFCGLMNRMKRNFRQDGASVTRKFDHLRKLLQFYDPDFYAYLSQNESDDLLFCYRWLLVELKREFTFEDALTVLEINWSSLLPDTPQGELEVAEPKMDVPDGCFCPYSTGARFKVHHGACSSTSSSGRGSGHFSKQESVLGDTLDQDDRSSSGDSSEFMMLQNSVTDGLHRELDYLDVAQNQTRHSSGAISNRTSATCSPRSMSMLSMDETLTDSRADRLSATSPLSPMSGTADVFLPADENCQPWQPGISDSGVSAEFAALSDDSMKTLPPPDVLGDGNPFLLFMCLTILLQHRDVILANRMQHHFELAMHFDKMIKKHNLQRTLLQARRMFDEYLKCQHQQRTAAAIENSSEESRNSF